MKFTLNLYCYTMKHDRTTKKNMSFIMGKKIPQGMCKDLRRMDVFFPAIFSKGDKLCGFLFFCLLPSTVGFQGAISFCHDLSG